MSVHCLLLTDISIYSFIYLEITANIHIEQTGTHEKKKLYIYKLQSQCKIKHKYKKFKYYNIIFYLTLK